MPDKIYLKQNTLQISKPDVNEVHIAHNEREATFDWRCPQCKIYEIGLRRLLRWSDDYSRLNTFIGMRKFRKEIRKILLTKYKE